MKQIIKSHTDVVTVPGELERMKQDYEMQGYDCELLANCLKINFDDGYAMIFWEDGAFWEDYFETKMEVEKLFGISFADLDEDSYEYRIMMRIQTDYENGKYDIEYYARMYGFY